MTLTEGALQITFNNAINGRKFDDQQQHRLSHCMKAVDFVVELPKRYLFIEIKDPVAPQASQAHGKHFLQRFKSGQLDESLKYKYRDSFLYEWASGRADKPIDYFVLITGLGKPGLLRRHDELKRKLPLSGPNSRPWTKPIVNRIGVFNMATWNSTFPHYPLTRI